MLPEFALGAEHAAEWQGAYDDRAGLLTYLQTDLGVDFPVDDWTYGIAHVREKMQRLEGATVLAESAHRQLARPVTGAAPASARRRLAGTAVPGGASHQR